MVNFVAWHEDPLAGLGVNRTTVDAVRFDGTFEQQPAHEHVIFPPFGEQSGRRALVGPDQLGVESAPVHHPQFITGGLLACQCLKRITF